VRIDLTVGRFGVAGLIVAIPSSSTFVEEFQGCLESLGFIVVLFDSGVRLDEGEDVGVTLWLCLCPFSVANVSRLPWKVKSEERCFRIILALVGSEEGDCTADDSLDTGNGTWGVAGDLTDPTSFLAKFLKGDIDLDNVLVRPDVRFPFALGGVAR
jgi:hypothetical protein